MTVTDTHPHHDTTHAGLDPVVRSTGEGPATWFLNSLVTTKVTSAETGGAYGITEHLLTAAANPPRHVQTDEEEAFYVLDGEIDFEVDGRVIGAGPGAFALVPRGVEHSFRVRSATARMLVVTSSGRSGDAPGGGLERFFESAGVPADSPSLPEPQAPDPVALTAAARVHGITILPPA